MSRENHFDKQILDMISPMPANEMERLLALNELELDYTDLDHSFADLTKLAAKIAGTSISMINLVDTFTQWTVAPFGMDIRQSPREDSVCQYTILEENIGGMEVNDLSADERFKDRTYVTEYPYLKYYYGIPIKLNDKPSIGTLCVVHEDYKNLNGETKEMLGLIAKEIVTRIKIRHSMNILKRQVQELNAIKNNVAHDIRGPISGIVGLAEIIQMQGEDNNLDEVLSYVSLIRKSGKSVLELADEVLLANQVSDRTAKNPKDHEFTLPLLEIKLLDLFGPQAITKGIDLSVEVTTLGDGVPFPKTNILQILGNLISNSIKFTPEGGSVKVILGMEFKDRNKELHIKVQDSGVGMSPGKIQQILSGRINSSDGTLGEKGYGFGLNLVHQLVSNLQGQMTIKSGPDQGAEFELILPFF